MHPVLTVFTKEFRENLRDRRTLYSALLFGPVLGPLIFAGGLSLRLERGVEQVERPLALAVAHPERAPNLLAFLRQYGLQVTPVDYDAAAARAAVQTHRYSQVLAVPPDFAARLAAGTPAALLRYADSSDVAAAADVARLSGLLNRYDSLITRLRMAARGIDPQTLAPLAVQTVDVATPASRSVLALGTLSYLVLLATLLGGMYLAIDATAGERERGSLEPLLTVPVRREQLIYGKILAACAYMTLSLSLTVLAFALLLRFTGLERLGMSVDFGPSMALRVVLYSLPLVPLGAALMTIVAAYTRSYREAQTWLGLVLLVPTLPLAFAGMLGLRPTLGLMAVPSLSQHFLITSVLRNEPVSVRYFAVSIAVTIALSALLITLAGRLYRREALLG